MKRRFMAAFLLIISFGFTGYNMSRLITNIVGFNRSINSIRPKTVCIVNNDGYCQALVGIDSAGSTTFYPTYTKNAVYAFKNIKAKHSCRYYILCRVSPRGYVSQVEVTEDLLRDYPNDILYIEVFTDSQKKPSVKVHNLETRL